MRKPQTEVMAATILILLLAATFSVGVNLWTDEAPVFHEYLSWMTTVSAAIPILVFSLYVNQIHNNTRVRQGLSIQGHGLAGGASGWLIWLPLLSAFGLMRSLDSEVTIGVAIFMLLIMIGYLVPAAKTKDPLLWLGFAIASIGIGNVIVTTTTRDYVLSYRAGAAPFIVLFLAAVVLGISLNRYYLVLGKEPVQDISKKSQAASSTRILQPALQVDSTSSAIHETEYSGFQKERSVSSQLPVNTVDKGREEKLNGLDRITGIEPELTGIISQTEVAVPSQPAVENAVAAREPEPVIQSPEPERQIPTEISVLPVRPEPQPLPITPLQAAPFTPQQVERSKPEPEPAPAPIPTIIFSDDEF